MDDIYAIRRNNLRTLLSKRTGGNQSELARKLGKDSPSLINRYLKDKPIGDDIAREAEAAFDLEANWMDNVHGAKLSIHHREVTPDGADVGAEWDKISDAAVREHFATLIAVYVAAQKNGELAKIRKRAERARTRDENRPAA